MREPPTLQCGSSPKKSLALPKGNALKTKNGVNYHHVEHGNKIADIFDLTIGYSNDRA